MDKKGIAIAGNMLVDVLYPIERTPKPGELTTIFEGISRSTGGAPCNTGTDLAKLDSKLPVKIIGRIGEDEYGDFVLEKMSKCSNMDLSSVVRKGETSFSAVMADTTTKQRTFYHYRGANAYFCEDDIDFDNLDVDIFHIGYILLLDSLDAPDDEYGTKMARLLHHVQQKGIMTSIDVVSEASDRYKKIVIPSLKYTDYCIINEIEAEHTTGVRLRDENDRLIPENMPEALRKIKEYGVSKWICIHCVEGGFGMDENGDIVKVDSLKLPKGFIKGSVGAGDAFCAGVLYGAWIGFDISEAIKLGHASSACSLSESGASEGMRSAEEAMKLYEQYSK